MNSPIKAMRQRRILELEEEIRQTENYLSSLRKQLAVARGGPRIKDAIFNLLDGSGPQSRQSIMSGLNAQGIAAGKRQAESQVGKSIDRLIRAGKLRVRDDEAIERV